MSAPAFTPRLRLYECEGMGLYWSVVEDGEHVADLDHDAVNRAYGGRIALVYSYKAYEAECARRIEADPEGWDCSDVEPAPVLAMVRHTWEVE